MRFGKVLSIVAIVAAALCVPARSAYAQGGSQKSDAAGTPQVQPAEDKKADAKKTVPKKEGGEKETAKKDSGETESGKKDNAEKDSGKKDGSGKGSDRNTQTPPWMTGTAAILDKVLSWALVALVFVMLFHRRLAALLDGLTQAMGERGVTLELAQVKIQVSERAQEIYENRGTRFSISPFELAPDRFEGFADISAEIPAQVTFLVSDDVAKSWQKDRPQHAEEAERKYTELKNKIGNAKRLDEVRKELIAFALALEQARFLGATRLAELLESNRSVRGEVFNLAKEPPSDQNERIMVHAAGFGYAQSGSWSDADELLKPIAWISGAPGHLPAADAWLAAMYHARIDKARSDPAPDDFGKEVVSIVDEVVSTAEAVLKAMDHRTTWSPTRDNIAYYRRELNKLLGIILAFRANYCDDDTQSKGDLARALAAYGICGDKIENEDPTSLDHNNLADAYRQLGRFDGTQYAKAHKEIGKALEDKPDDPTFLNTKALILIGENKLIDALDVLTAVPQSKTPTANPQDIVQYIENQLLAAKVVARTDRPRRFLQAADILEGTERFLDNHVLRLDKHAARLKAELNELLGFTYLSLPGYERRSVERFDGVAQLWAKVKVTAEVRWRRRVGTVRAHTRLARESRRDFDYGTAADQRRRGRKVINDNLSELAKFSLAAGKPEFRLRNARVHLDTAMALQGLAEESFHGGELDDTRELLKKKDEIVATLGNFREHETIGAKIRLAAAHTGLLRGRVVFHSDPGTYEPAVLTDIEANLVTARGQNPLLDCVADLALGEAFLAAALAGKEGDAEANYRKAIDALERAAGRNAPSLRADATRALLAAYAQRPVVQRRAKAKESKRA